MNLIKYLRSILIALKAHRGQLDKAGKRYIFHPIRVSLCSKSWDGKIVAVLHDVLEDSKYSESDLSFLSKNQLDALKLLNHDKRTPYFMYVKKLKGNATAREVKMCDLADNMNLRRIKNPTAVDYKRIEKYKLAKAILLEKDNPPE